MEWYDPKDKLPENGRPVMAHWSMRMESALDVTYCPDTKRWRLRMISQKDRAAGKGPKNRIYMEAPFPTLEWAYYPWGYDD